MSSMSVLAEKYTRLDFEKALSGGDYHRLVLLRSGCFVGLYRYTYERSRHCLRLWKAINDEDYGRSSWFSVRHHGSFWGRGGGAGPGVLVECNELHFVPNACRVTSPEDCAKLNKALGGCYSEVRSRIEQSFPMPKPEIPF